MKIQTLRFYPRATLPTGRWLTRERMRLAMTSPQLARRLRQHPSTVAAVERQNYVVPPGWYPELRKLGLLIPEPRWPVLMEPYFGWQLKEEMATRRTLHLSPFWLRRKLAVPDAEVASVLAGNRLVPRTWLLKLAELGLHVPLRVRRALAAASRLALPAAELPGTETLRA